MRSPRIVRHGHPPFLGWAILVVLLLVVKLGQGIHCNQLKPISSKGEWLDCDSNPFMLEPIVNAYNETEYPPVDISDFDVDNFAKFVEVRVDGEPESLIRTFVGNLVCSGSSLTSIKDLAFKIQNENISQSVRIENNLNLTTVNFQTILAPKSKIGTIKFTVANNKLLSQESIDNLNNLTYLADDSYIQRLGECVIEPGKQKSFEDLDKCHYVKGDLVINENTDVTSEFPTTLEDIHGCISIKSTNLTNLDLLDHIKKSNCTGTHEITNNPNLCIFPEDYEKLVKKFKRMSKRVKVENNSWCKGECSWTYLHNIRDQRCLIIPESVSIAPNTAQKERTPGSVDGQETALKEDVKPPREDVKGSKEDVKPPKSKEAPKLPKSRETGKAPK